MSGEYHTAAGGRYFLKIKGAQGMAGLGKLRLGGIVGVGTKLYALWRCDSIGGGTSCTNLACTGKGTGGGDWEAKRLRSLRSLALLF